MTRDSHLLADAVAGEGEALDQLGKTLNLDISSAQTLLHLSLSLFFFLSPQLLNLGAAIEREGSL